MFAERERPATNRMNFFARTAERLVSFTDQAVVALSPETGLRRMAFRQKATEFSYDAANPGTRRGGSGGMFKNAAAESWAVQRDRIKLIWDARDAERNFAFIDGVLSKLSMYVCGKIMYMPDTGDKATNQLYQNFFHGWCERADFTGRARFREMVELAFRSFLRDGDFGFNIVEDGQEIRLQSIEADRIGSPIDAQQDEKYIGGFTLGERGEIVSVRVYDRTRFGQYVNPEEIPPENFIHICAPKRADQYRGVSHLANCLAHARDIYEWFATEKQAGKTASLFSAFVLPKDPYAAQAGGNPSGVDWNNDDSDGVPKGTPSMKARAGLVIQLQNGEKVEFPNIPSRPSGAFLQFVQVLVREMSIGLNLPYGFIYNMGELGGNTSRVEVMQAVRSINRWQQMLVDQLLDRVKNLVIARAISFGQLPPPPTGNWRGGRWQFGPALTGDVGYQTQADISQVKMGRKSMEEWCGEGGTTPGEVGRSNAHTVQELQEISMETGVPVEMLAPDMFPNGTQALAAMNTPPPKPPKDLLSKLGGAKELKPMLDTLALHGRGEATRDSTVETLMLTYGLSREQAEALVPDEEPPALENMGQEPGKEEEPAESNPIKRKGAKK